MDSYGMLRGNEVEYGLMMELVNDSDEARCTRKSSASYQLGVVALLSLKAKVKDVKPIIGWTSELRVAYPAFQGDR